MQLDYYASTYQGIKLENHDSHTCLYDQRKGVALFAVADGVSRPYHPKTGHHPQGVGPKKASLAAINFMHQCFIEDSGWSTIDEDGMRELLTGAANRVGDYLKDVAARRKADDPDLGKPHTECNATTLDALVLLEDRTFHGHIGDGRLYGLKDNNIVQLTHDNDLHDSWLGMPGLAFEKGKNIIPLTTGDYEGFILCTDGVTKLVSQEQLATAFYAQKTAQDTCETIMGLIKDAKVERRDDATLVVVRLKNAMVPEKVHDARIKGLEQELATVHAALRERESNTRLYQDAATKAEADKKVLEETLTHFSAERQNLLQGAERLRVAEQKAAELGGTVAMLSQEKRQLEERLSQYETTPPIAVHADNPTQAVAAVPKVPSSARRFVKKILPLALGAALVAGGFFAVKPYFHDYLTRPQQTAEESLRPVEKEYIHTAPITSPKQSEHEMSAVTHEPTTKAAHVQKLSLADLTNQRYTRMSDPGTVKSWNQERNEAWYNIAARPGVVEQQRWKLPVTVLRSTDEADTILLTLAAEQLDSDTAFRLLFKDGTHAYCRPGIETQLQLSKEAYQGPVQYELVKENNATEKSVNLHVLASGRNLYLIPHAQQSQHASVSQPQKPAKLHSQDNIKYAPEIRQLQHHDAASQRAEAGISSTIMLPIIHNPTHETPAHGTYCKTSIAELCALRDRFSEYCHTDIITLQEHQRYQRLIGNIDKTISNSSGGGLTRHAFL